MKIYICFAGEYEQRGATAAFTSAEIAAQYSNDVEEFELWDRLPKKLDVFEANGVFKGSAPLHWKQEGDWHVKRNSFSSDDYSLQSWSREKISYWGGLNRPEGGIYVEVTGESREKVDERFAELRADVEGGRKP